MKTTILKTLVSSRCVIVCASFLGAQLININMAQAQEDVSIFEEVIKVTGVREDKGSNHIQPESERLIAPDAAGLVQRLPGAALINNGSLSGQIQYRGVFGNRVGTKINNQSFHSGGPNLMDPPMHYAPPTLIESITVQRGVSSVDFGPSLSGGVNTNLKDLNYVAGADYQSQYDITAIGRSADESYAIGGIAGVTNNHFKIVSLFSMEEGSDQRFAGGEISNTFHDRRVLGLIAGYRTDLSELTLSARQHKTNPTGNAPFSMDINLVDTDFFTANYLRTIGEARLTVDLGYTDVYHEMNNFKFRAPPSSAAGYRETEAAAKTNNARVELAFNIVDTAVKVGIDYLSSDIDVTIFNPLNPNFFVNNLAKIDLDRTGFYANVENSFSSWNYSVGARIDDHSTSAGEASYGSAVPGAAQNLANVYKASDRSRDDQTVDVVARIWKRQDALTWHFSLAMKNRAPDFLERYAWLPTPASAGLADGNNYVGDLNIKPETAKIIEAGVDFNDGNLWLRPTIYYQQIDDYIQGVPFDSTPGVIDSPVEMVSSAGGDRTPLRFSNVDAKIYGLDADYGYRLSSDWRLEGVVSIVRGERRDINDDLYRISPDKVSMSLVYDQAEWSVSAETVFLRKQNRVSLTNSELESAGYGLLNLHGTWRVNPRVSVSVGLENLLDKRYENHLAGYNRVSNSDVALGAQIPGVGRSLQLRVHVRSL